tara:strand:- start:196 stop:567 length:372 start_codon:yes stop_codon:yes gene_type:complete
MTIASKTVPGNLASTRSSDLSVNATPQFAVAGAGSLFGAYIDNTGNGAPTYVKIYDQTAGNITVGTTVPEHIIMVPAGAARQVSIPAGLPFANGIGYAAVTAGGTGGTSAPASAVSLRLLMGS